MEKLQETLDDLEQAERELAADQKQAEEKLAREQLERLADQLKSLLARQQAMIGETERLQLEFEAAEKWTRARLKSLRNLTETQQNLQKETTTAAENVSSIEIVALSLRGAARYMQRAIELLDERNTSQETVAVQQLAVRRFEELLKALEEDDQKHGNAQSPEQNPDQDESSAPTGDIVTLIAQLKVIRSLQQDLTERFRAVRGRADSSSELTDSDQAELQQIAEEQALIADLIREMTSAFGDPKAAPAEDQPQVDPESLLNEN